jgi:hypothetical protein
VKGVGYHDHVIRAGKASTVLLSIGSHMRRVSNIVSQLPARRIVASLH